LFPKTLRSWLAHMFSGSVFHVAGPVCEKARSPNLVHSFVWIVTPSHDASVLWTVIAQQDAQNKYDWVWESRNQGATC